MVTRRIQQWWRSIVDETNGQHKDMHRIIDLTHPSSLNGHHHNVLITFKTLLFVVFCSLLVPLPQYTRLHPKYYAQAQQVLVSPNQLQPFFTKSMDSLNIRENTPIDELIYTLEAQTEPQYPGVRFSYDIEGTQLFSVDHSSGQVRVAQQIDREQTGDSISLQVSAVPYFMNRPGTQTKLTVIVYVMDENDNAPRIERVKVGRQEYDAQAVDAASNQLSGGTLQQGSARVPVIKLNLSEDAPVDSVVVDLIEAIDVDKASSNPLGALCLDCEPEFKLAPRTTSLLNDRLEWSILLIQPIVHVPRQNVRPLHVLVSDGKFNSSIVFELTIEDVQNKPPHFISSTTCIVQENTPIDRTILTLQAVDGDAIALDDGLTMMMSAGKRPHSSQYNGRQIVYDFIDQSSGQSSSYQEDFKLNPLTGQLQVANRLDRESYLNINGVISLQVRARELTVDAETVLAGDDLYESTLQKLANFIDRSELSATVSEVTIILTDVNDNSPRWLNASEVASMSRAPVWYQSLPSDRDTGRNYQLKVRENSLPGTPITGKNEMFVYDLDSGENAEFNITLEDPFNLFEVEPKRVSGFASVSIKLSTGSGRRRSLDFENVNERSYIIQLYAIETRTQEQYRSKAQVQVNVLDVNDNAPEFKEAAYVANIREDAPAGKMVKVIQATDRDEVSKQLTYTLHGQSAYLFNIHPVSGLITVARCERNAEQQQQQQRSTRYTTAISVQYASLSSRPCIDYETQRLHHLMVEVSDGELSSRVPLTIWIEDASDNAPVFSLPIVDVVIEEGAERLEPPIKLEATDADQTSTLSYSIVEGNFEGLFTINNATGELQLTRPIRIAHDDDEATSAPTSLASMSSGFNPSGADLVAARNQQQLNKMTLIVQASDGEHSANGTVRIDILDANDNAPNFSRAQYEKEIGEFYAPGQSVLTVKAFDMDRGNNARVSYRIERGSHGQFDINEQTGEIQVALSARPFDALRRAKYTLEVVAYDHGLVSKSSSVQVLIKVLSGSKRAPEFEPQIQRETINENTLNNTIVHRMQVSDPLRPEAGPRAIGSSDETLSAQALMFEPGPIEGLDKYGQPVSDVSRLESMFSVSTHTGDVLVNSGLNHDFAAYVNLTIYVSYRPIQGLSALIGAHPAQTGTGDSLAMNYLNTSASGEFAPRSVGYLIINVMDENDNAPIFAAPWTPSQPELSFQMLEELPVGSILTQLVASDADSKISHFEIEPPNEYFELSSPQSGIIVNKKLIDYDTLMRQTFLTPAAHRTANAGGVQTSSTSPSVPPPSSSNNIIQFNVVVYDSGLKQLTAKAIVSVEILPINDNECKFEQQVYEVHVREHSSTDTLVSQVRAIDLDYGEQHSTINYQLMGELHDLFKIDVRTGVITVSARGSLGLDREQLAQPVILLTVLARDDLAGTNEQQRPMITESTLHRSSAAANNRQQARPIARMSGRSCSTTVRVFVDDINDNPPLFSQKIYEVTAFDTDTINVPLVKLLVHDEDSKHNNLTVARGSGFNPAAASTPNSFRILSGNLNDSFNITQTGMIYVTKRLNDFMGFNRGPLELRIQVKQQSTSAAPNGPQPIVFTDECIVRVHSARINRHVPEWRFESLKSATIVENSPPGTRVALLQCHDPDFPAALEQSGASVGLQWDERQVRSQSKRPNQPHAGLKQASIPVSPIRYWIKENGLNVLETNEFKLDSASGELVSRIELDRERRAFYQLIVSCEDNGRPQSLETITPLYVSVLDVDDNEPEFVVSSRGQMVQASEWPSNEASAPSDRHSDAAFQSNGAKLVDSVHPRSVQFFVEEHQSKGLQVGELKAVDRDSEQSHKQILYCLVEGNEFNEFALDQVTGILYTNKTLDRETQASYDLLVRAINDGSACSSNNEGASSLAPHDEPLMAEEQRLETSSNGTNMMSSRAKSSGMPKESAALKRPHHAKSSIRVRVNVLDINDNAPTFKRPSYRAAVHHRALMNTLVTHVAAYDPDNELNGTLNYRISEILLYKTNPSAASGQHQQSSLSKPIKLIQSPFKIDQSGNIYTQQLLTQYQLMSMFLLNIEVSEQADPWRAASTKLEIYIYETHNQLKIRIGLHPRLVESYRHEIEAMLSNATKYKAIINRARSYHGYAQSDTFASKQKQTTQTTSLKANDQQSGQAIDLTQQLLQQHKLNNQVPFSSIGSDYEPNYSNIHAIFIDNHRIINPNVVMEKFDLTSAQLFAPESLLMRQNPQLTSSQANDALAVIGSQGARELSPLIDKIALASLQTAEPHTSGIASLANIDWLESPSVLFVCLGSMLFFIGLVICMIGYCCTSRIKDHIIKVAMDKLVKQQALQAKINERVLAATNQAYANSTLGAAGKSLADGNGDFILQPANLAAAGGPMSSFDATKSCVSNNFENMSIMQRALEAGEFIDPNYSTLNPNGVAHPFNHLNLCAHYYDASELEQQQEHQHERNGSQNNDEQFSGGLTKQVNGSVISLSLDDDDDDEDNAGDNFVEAAHVKGNTVMNGLAPGVTSKLEAQVYVGDDDAQQPGDITRLSNHKKQTNGISGQLISNTGHANQRQRQQIPANYNHSHH